MAPQPDAWKLSRNNGAPGSSATRPRVGRAAPQLAGVAYPTRRARAGQRHRAGAHAPDTGRLVTLTGTGGCGRTQLALLVATSLIDVFADGCWLVELASLQSGDLVPYALPLRWDAASAGAWR